MIQLMIKVTQKLASEEYAVGDTNQRQNIKITPQFVSSMTKNLRFPYTWINFIKIKLIVLKWFQTVLNSRKSVCSTSRLWKHWWLRHETIWVFYPWVLKLIRCTNVKVTQRKRSSCFAWITIWESVLTAGRHLRMTIYAVDIKETVIYNQ